MSEPAQTTTYWGNVGSGYAALGHPLRPSRADLECMRGAARKWAKERRRSPEVVMLGATPRIAQMKWPARTKVLGTDASFPMIRAIWPGNVAGVRAAACANWRALPLRDASRDIAIGDGSLSCVRYPDSCRAVAAEIRRVLRDDGLLILRAYVQKEPRERKEDVVAELLDGAMPSFHWFKFRLLMAMQEDAARGVAVAEVYRYWESLRIDARELAAMMGWGEAGIRLMELYQGTETVHTFHLLEELQNLLTEFFEDVTVERPSAFLGERCPILIARPRSRQERTERLPGAALCAL